MKINIKLLTLFCLLINAFCSNAQKTINSSFWEKVDNKVTNPYRNMPTTIDKVSSKVATFTVNQNGTMILGCGGKGLGVGSDVVYVSNDGGKTWEWLSTLKKYEDFYFTTPYISASGKYFTTGTFLTYYTDREPVYLLSTDGKNWEVVKKSEMLNRNFYGHRDNSLVEVKNGKLSDYINENPEKLRRIYYSDGTVKIDKGSNVFYYNSNTGTYSRTFTEFSKGEWTFINDVYHTCDGKYYTYTGGRNLISDDEVSYKPIVTNFFVKTSGFDNSPEDVKFFPVCGTWFAIGKKNGTYEKKLYFKNENEQWEDTGFYSDVNILYNPKTKRYYLYNNPQFYGEVQGNLVQSKKTYECSCQPSTLNAPEITYGTTIITHDMLTDNNFPKDGGWMDRMATAILKKAVYGNVYFYKKETGELVKLIESGNGLTGENIIIFDWSDESLIFGKGSTESAAEALFVALVSGYKQGLFTLKNIHIIGHGRGCTVNSLVVERLHSISLSFQKDISISQVTNLGPFDSGYSAWWEPGDVKLDFWDNDIDDAHPDKNIIEPLTHKRNNGVIAWYGIYSDTYWQNNGKTYINNLAQFYLPAEEKYLDNEIVELLDKLNCNY